STNNLSDFNESNLKHADVAIEFTNPHSAVKNIEQCLNFGLPIVCGSTGWLNDWHGIENLCKQKNGTLLYASNFSIGVNLFFELNTFLARLMSQQKNYDVMIEEIHHTQKKDAPSGTAITLAEQVLQYLTQKNKWVNYTAEQTNELQIISERKDPAPGTHKIKYTSTIDDIEIIHTAHNRKGFANGAVLAAEYIFNKKGIFTMKQVLGLEIF
ncbi:MAG TPA: 4-hydroxy-tetrahydrodipicolinate reductase, partial [Chitinophagaceae bacterium]|nr:4-hydroxy-tetrahydrodipicolinate reductase [Chitinophagaceae bacterium]